MTRQAIFPSRARSIAAALLSLFAVVVVFAYISAPVGAQRGIDPTYQQSDASVVKGCVDEGDLAGTRVNLIFVDANGEVIDKWTVQSEDDEKKQTITFKDDGCFEVKVPEGAANVLVVIITPDGKHEQLIEVRPGQSIDLGGDLASATAAATGGGPVPLLIPY